MKLSKKKLAKSIIKIKNASCLEGYVESWINYEVTHNGRHLYDILENIARNGIGDEHGFMKEDMNEFMMCYDYEIGEKVREIFNNYNSIENAIDHLFDQGYPTPIEIIKLAFQSVAEEIRDTYMEFTEIRG